MCFVLGSMWFAVEVGGLVDYEVSKKAGDVHAGHFSFLVGMVAVPWAIIETQRYLKFVLLNASKTTKARNRIKQAHGLRRSNTSFSESFESLTGSLRSICPCLNQRDEIEEGIKVHPSDKAKPDTEARTPPVSNSPVLTRREWIFSNEIMEPVAAYMGPGNCQFDDTWVPVKMLERRTVAKGSIIVTFECPDTTKPLGLSTCACLLMRGNPLDPRGAPLDDRGQYMVKPYTPISTNAMIGKFELMVRLGFPLSAHRWPR